jgi:hypothetical protein
MTFCRRGRPKTVARGYASCCWRANGSSRRDVGAGGVGSKHDDLARRLVQQPAHVLGTDARPAGGRGGDHDPVKALARDRLTQRVAVAATTRDPRVDPDAKPRRALLDRF